MSVEGAPASTTRVDGTGGLALASRLAGLCAVVLLQVIWERQALPLGVRVFHVAFIGVALWSPSAALLVLAGLGPIAGDLWRLLGGQAGASDRLIAMVPGGTRLLEQMVLAVLTGWVARWQAEEKPSRLAAPATLLAVVALASAATVLPARLFAASPDLGMLGQAGQFLSGRDLTPLPEWRPLFFALYAVEGLALACMVERLVRRTPAIVPRLLGLLLAAEAAAAVLTIGRAVQGAMGGPDWWRTLRDLVARERMSRYTDPNATASMFVLVALAGVALLRRPAWRLWSTSAALVLVLAGLWLSGSRTAMAALGVAGITGLVVRSDRSILGTRRGRLVLVAGVSCVLLLGTCVVRLNLEQRNIPLAFTLKSRWIVARAGLRMAATSPVFGVGIGTFWDHSAEFGTSVLPGLARDQYLWVPDPHENAHDNFLQILAEEGLLGLATFCIVLAASLLPSWRSRRELSAQQGWVLAGILGFILTWFTGHPLLVPEAAFAFWLVFGIATGLLSAPLRSRGKAWGWLVIALAISLPARVLSDLRLADFSHVAVGLGAWAQDADGTAYRAGGSPFALYVPANRIVVVPIRRASDLPSALRVELRVEGRIINSVWLTGTDWRPVELLLPSKTRHFVRVDFTVSDPAVQPAPAHCIDVGVDEAR